DETRNSLMVDPPKATKGRRMSKKSRKKSPKTSPGGKARTKVPAKSKAKAGTSRRMAAKKALKDATSGPSHKAASKMLSSPDPARGTATGRNRRAEKNSSALAGPPRAGDKAPAFHLPREGGTGVAFSVFSGKKLVFFFSPKAVPRVCPGEAIAFTRLSNA